MELLLKILQPFFSSWIPSRFSSRGEEQWNEAAKWPQKLVGSKRLLSLFFSAFGYGLSDKAKIWARPIFFSEDYNSKEDFAARWYYENILPDTQNALGNVLLKGCCCFCLFVIVVPDATTITTEVSAQKFQFLCVGSQRNAKCIY